MLVEPAGHGDRAPRRLGAESLRSPERTGPHAVIWVGYRRTNFRVLRNRIQVFAVRSHARHKSYTSIFAYTLDADVEAGSVQTLLGADELPVAGGN